MCMIDDNYAKCTQRNKKVEGGREGGRERRRVGEREKRMAGGMRTKVMVLIIRAPHTQMTIIRAPHTQMT